VPSLPTAIPFAINDTQAQNFDKITSRISKLAYGLNPDFCDPVRLFTSLLLVVAVEESFLASFSVLLIRLFV